MANVVKEQKLVDSNKHTVVKYVATVDTVAANVSMLVAANLAYALTSNGNNILTPGDWGNTKSNYRTTIKRVWGQGQFKSKGYVTLSWGSRSNTEIVTFGDGQFDYNFDAEGLCSAIGTPANITSNGDILISTTGVAAGDAFTLFIDLKKDGRDFGQGQHRDPIAFNYGAGYNGS
jgi:hypothetical protein